MALSYHHFQYQFLFYLASFVPSTYLSSFNCYLYVIVLVARKGYFSVVLEKTQLICSGPVDPEISVILLVSFVHISRRQSFKLFKPFSWEKELWVDTIVLVERWSWKFCFSVTLRKTQPICLGLWDTVIWPILPGAELKPFLLGDRVLGRLL